MTRVTATHRSVLIQRVGRASCGAVDARDLADDPIAQLEAWVVDSRAAGSQADLMTLATADAGGRPSARIVLLRGVDERGLTFFTNRTSRKGRELADNPRAAAVLHWWELGRQVRVEGTVAPVSDEESRAYWTTRPRGSQIAAWASRQSQPLTGRDELEARVAELEARFAGDDVPLPPFWGGYRLAPECIELWEHRESRLHDRIRYERTADAGWRRERLAP
jgi:pyridoxamine 5'-phosphate oxidase